MSITAAVMVGAKVLGGVMQASAGRSTQRAMNAQADRTLESGETQAGLLREYAGRQQAYAGLYSAYAERSAEAMRRQTGLRYMYAERSADLEEQEIPLMIMSIEREVEAEEKMAIDRQIGRQRELNQALASQVALRTAQGIQAYEGSPIAMMGADINQFDQDQAIDKAETARRIVDNRFFASERAKLMSDRISLLRFGAATELDTGMQQAELVKQQALMQAESIRLAAEGTLMSAESRLDASELEAEAIRIQGRTAATSGYMGAANSLLDAAQTYRNTRIPPTGN